MISYFEDWPLVFRGYIFLRDFSTSVCRSIVNHYYFTFDTPSTAPSITWPAAITMWADGDEPTIEESTHYEVSVINGVAAIMGVKLPDEEEGE